MLRVLTPFCLASGCGANSLAFSSNDREGDREKVQRVLRCRKIQAKQATFVQVWHWTSCCTLSRGIHHNPWYSGAFWYSADVADSFQIFKFGLYQIYSCYLCTRNVQKKRGSCGISRDCMKNPFSGTVSIQKITCLLSKCSVDSYLSFQASCNTFSILHYTY